MATNDSVASHLGISPTRVSELKSAGILPEARRRANNLTACRIAYLAHLRAVAAGRGSKDGGGFDLVGERARLAAAQAERVERENAIAAGEFIRVAEFHLMMTASFARVRSKLLALPSRLAPVMAPAMTPAAAQAALKSEVYAALNELGATRIAGISEDGEIIEAVTKAEEGQK